MATGFGLRLAGPSPPAGGGWEIEDRIAEAMALRGELGEVLGSAGNIAFFGTMVYRFIDSALVPTVYWGNTDVAWQMLMIDLEAFSIVSAVVWGGQAFVGRQRPRFRDCPEAAPAWTSCQYFGSNRYRSFITGHFALTTAGASLTCLHHARLGLYGGGAADDIACGAHVAVALTTGVSRLAREEHYLSDTLLAGALGVLAGYVVPAGLHYGFGADQGCAEAHCSKAAASKVRWTLVPFSPDAKLGVSAVGLF